MVRTYSLHSDGGTLLSKNFSVREFSCHDGSDRILIADETVVLLQTIRDHFGKPVLINSAYRSPAWNKKQGGATRSQHLLGTAVDIHIDGVPPLKIAQYAEAIGAGGIGLYKSFTHVDARAKRTRWDSTSGKEKSVTGFNPQRNYRVTAQSGLRLRSAPGTTEKVVATIPCRTTVNVLEFSNGWANVSYHGQLGWCSTQFLRRV